MEDHVEKIEPHSRLRQVLDETFLRDLNAIVASTTRVALHVTDPQGALLCDPAPRLAWCRLMSNVGPYRGTALMRARFHCPKQAGEVAEYCCDGVRYVVSPILLEAEVVGQAVLGPMLVEPYPASWPAEMARKLGLPEEELITACQGLPLMTNGELAAAGKMVTSLASAVSRHIALVGEKERLYREAQLAHDRLETIFRGMADGVIIVDKNGEVAMVNRAGVEIIGFQPVLGRIAGERDPHFELLHSDGSPFEPGETPLHLALRTGEPVFNAELLVRRADGEERICQVSAAPVADVAGVVTGAVAVFRDISAFKTVERLKEEFISIAAHEFRAPLTAISGYTQMLARQLSTREGMERERKELDLVRVHTRRLASLIHNLVDITRMKSGQLSLNRRRVDLPSLMRTSVDNMRALSSKHTLELELDDEGTLVLADPERIDQVLTNLIGNAVKYSPDGGRVLISLNRATGEAVISVRDRGIGMSVKQLHHVFEPFYCADNADNRQFEGIGLGLHISKMLIEAHGGRIWAASRRGRGSTFTFALPIAEG
ncbi:MAG: PAS domain S-box protein [Chloroflexi bacterium]|nr:PAS domain S-box protein [Chloroflexota bacterium]